MESEPRRGGMICASMGSDFNWGVLAVVSPLRGLLFWGGSVFYNNVAPSGLAFLGWIRFLQSCRPFGACFFGVDPFSTIISPLRGLLFWGGSVFYNHVAPSGLAFLGWIRFLQSCRPFGACHRRGGLKPAAIDFLALGMPSKTPKGWHDCRMTRIVWNRNPEGVA